METIGSILFWNMFSVAQPSAICAICEICGSYF